LPIIFALPIADLRVAHLDCSSSKNLIFKAKQMEWKEKYLRLQLRHDALERESMTLSEQLFRANLKILKLKRQRKSAMQR
jgi:hypothetical protein